MPQPAHLPWGIWWPRWATHSLTFTRRVQGWIHTVTLEPLPALEADLEVPYCLAGEQACPPDFCIGIWGYEELLDRLGDADDPESDALWEKIGYDFDPNWFDLKDVNQRLQKFR